MTPAESISNLDRSRKRLFAAAFSLLLLYGFVRNLVNAAVRPFWFDELLTWVVARQPNISLMWRSLALGADGQPLPYYIVVRMFDKLIRNDQISFRLPSILAFCLMEVCLFIWLKRRHSSTVAFVAVLIPFLTTIFDSYTVEARPYCLLVACLSAALLAYQHVPAIGWTIALGIALLLAQSFHYYAVFAAIPFFLAELFFFVKTKMFRWRVWLALSLVVVPLLVFWPILSSFKSYYSGPHYWSHPRLLAALRIYGRVFGLNATHAQTFPLPIIVIGYSLAAAALVVAVVMIFQSLRADPRLDPLFHERVLIAGFLLLPLILYGAAKLFDGGYTDRYLLPVVIGFVLSAALCLNLLSRKSLILVGAVLCVGIAAREMEFWFSYTAAAKLGFAQPKPAEQLVTGSHSSLPVVISDSSDYFEMEHYATPLWKKRFNYLADPEAAVAYGKPDTTEKEMLVVRKFAPLQVFSLKDFITSNPKFLLFSDPKSYNNPDWWVLRLVADGYSVKPVTSDGHDTVYLVEFKNAD